MPNKDSIFKELFEDKEIEEMEVASPPVIGE